METGIGCKPKFSRNLLKKERKRKLHNHISLNDKKYIRLTNESFESLIRYSNKKNHVQRQQHEIKKGKYTVLEYAALNRLS